MAPDASGACLGAGWARATLKAMARKIAAIRMVRTLSGAAGMALEWLVQRGFS
jgi:hypothetical protein